MDRLIVEQDGETLTCHKQGDTGMYIEGRGATVAEAVGDWCIHSALIEVVCKPPKLLERYSMRFDAAAKR